MSDRMQKLLLIICSIAAILLVVFFAFMDRRAMLEQQKAITKLEFQGYMWEDHDIQGMKYRIFFRGYGHSPVGGMVINLTKDALEVELLKKQLEIKKR